MQGWPSLAELAGKALLPLLLTPVMLVVMPLLLLGRADASRPLLIGVCPQDAVPPAVERIGDRPVKLTGGSCPQLARALRLNEVQALVEIRATGETGEADRVLFKASQTRGRESVAAARQVSFLMRNPQHSLSDWPHAVAVDSDLELSVGMLLIVLPALLVQWLLGAVAPALVQAVDGSVPDRASRLRLHARVALLGGAGIVGYLAGIWIATMLGNYVNSGTVQMIRELDASVSATPSLTSDVEIVASFLVMSASFLVVIAPAVTWLAVSSRSRMSFSGVYQVLALSLIMIVMATGYAASSRALPYAAYVPLASAAQGLAELVRGPLRWESLVVPLLVNAIAGAFCLLASLRVREGRVPDAAVET